MNDQDVMLSVECDKLLETFSMRIPAITKQYLDKLNPAQKKKTQRKNTINHRPGPA